MARAANSNKVIEPYPVEEILFAASYLAAIERQLAELKDQHDLIQMRAAKTVGTWPHQVGIFRNYWRKDFAKVVADLKAGKLRPGWRPGSIYDMEVYNV